MEIKEIQYELSEVGVHSPENYTKTYLNNEDGILSWINSFDGLKSNIYLDFRNKNIDSWMRFSLLFSDFISLLPSHGKTNSLVFPMARENEPRNSIELSIPGNIMHRILKFTPEPKFIPEYFSFGNKEINNLCSDLNSTMKSGKLIFRPERVIFEGIKPNEDTSIFSLFHVSPDSPLTKWNLIDSPEEQKSLPVFSNNQISGIETELFEITVPYLDGISFKDLNLLIDDEYDLLSSFRVELKSAVKNALQNNNYLDLKNDILRPKLDTLDRKFKSIQNLRLLKNLGVVTSSLVISLVAIPISGLLAVSKFLGLSLGSAGLIKNEIDNVKATDSLKDEPFYLLWRIKGLKKN